MDGVLEATISLFGCKVLCSLLCLPTFQTSISSVSLCCSCLLLFTDLSITVFLTYLWCGAPGPLWFEPSSDVIALHFGLFLGDTYGAVLLLTPAFLAVEVLMHLLWPGEDTVVVSADGQGGKEEARRSDATLLFSGDPWGKGAESVWALQAVGFLGCLLLWVICGLYAESSWRREQLSVRACLEGGRSLCACLPCLFSASSPITQDLTWVLPSAALLLGLAPGLGFLTAKLARALVQPDQSVRVEPLRHREDTTALQLTLGRPLCQSCLSHHDDDTTHTPSGNLVLAPIPVDRWKLNSQGVFLLSQWQSKLPVEGRATVGSTGQAPPPCEGWDWPRRESPCLRGGVMTGLVCAFLVCLCPVVLSTNIALISSLDTLAGYIVQQLLTPPQNK